MLVQHIKPSNILPIISAFAEGGDIVIDYRESHLPVLKGGREVAEEAALSFIVGLSSGHEESITIRDASSHAMMRFTNRSGKVFWTAYDI